MAAILSGSSSTAVRYIFSHWLDLIQVSLVPFVGTMAIFATQTVMVGNMLSDVIVADPTEAAVLNAYGQFQGTSLILTLAGYLIGVWQFVKIVRLYLRDELSWIGLTKPVFTATLMTFLYAIGIFLVLLLLAVVAVLVCIIPFVLMTGDGDVDTGTGILIVLLSTVSFAIVLWVLSRFNVGLPGVALGETPDFFKDLWGLSKGASWGYPLRVLGGMLALMLVLIPIAFVSAWFIHGSSPGTPPATVTPEIFRDYFHRAAMGQVLLAVIMQPAYWFFMLLTAECYRRFKAARSGNIITAAPGSIRT